MATLEKEWLADRERKVRAAMAGDGPFALRCTECNAPFRLAVDVELGDLDVIRCSGCSHVFATYAVFREAVQTELNKHAERVTS